MESLNPAAPTSAPQTAPTPAWMLVCVIALGGAAGTMIRAVLEHQWPADSSQIPWTTLSINVVGSLVLAALLEYLALSGPDRGARKIVRLGVGTGVIGGFTTYSTFIIEVERLLTGGWTGLGLVYGLGSVALGIGAAAVGILVSRGIRRRLGSPSATRKTGEH